MTRLTNAFSKKAENHAHMMALYFMHYNFVRQHQTLLVAGPNSSLYDTAGQGAPSGAGAIFALKPKTNKFTALYDFTGGADGGLPQTGLVPDAAGVLYGVTSYGNGTIFKITP